MSSPDTIISQAMRYLAGMPDHPSTGRVLDVAKPLEIFFRVNLPSMNVINFSYGNDDYPEMGDLFLRRTHIAPTDDDIWGVIRTDAEGEVMMQADGSWGWTVRLADLYIFTKKQAIEKALSYIEGVQAEIKSLRFENS